MSKRTEEKRNLENILRLDSLRGKLQGNDLRNLDRVLEEMRSSVGDTVSKSNAAEMLHVSRQTVDKWIHKDIIPAVRSGSRERIPRQSVERIVKEARSLKEKNGRSTLADALRSLATEVEGKPKKKASTKKAKASTKASTQKAKTAAKSSTKKSKTAAQKTDTKKKTSSKAK